MVNLCMHRRTIEFLQISTGKGYGCEGESVTKLLTFNMFSYIKMRYPSLVFQREVRHLVM